MDKIIELRLLSQIKNEKLIERPKSLEKITYQLKVGPNKHDQNVTLS